MPPNIQIASRAARLTVLALAVTVPAGAQQRSPFWGDLTPGEYGVGFTARFVFDESRIFWPAESTAVRDLGRPLRILIWYPSEPAADTTMTYGAYREVRPADQRFDYYNRVLRGAEYSTSARQFSPESDSLLAVVSQLRTMARRDVPPTRTRHPLIVHSLGLGDYQLEQTILFEYLASHGYVVATVPQMGARPWGGGSFDRGFVETQAADIMFAMDLLSAEPYVDADRIGITGHSMGGLVGAVVASRRPDVRAVVGLDGSFVTPDGIPILNALGWPGDNMRAPLLDIRRPRAEADLTALTRLPEYYRVIIGGSAPPEIATHFDFQNWPVFATLVGVEDPRGERARPAEFGFRVLQTAIRITKRFLDDALNGEPPSVEQLVEGLEAGVPLEPRLVTNPRR